MKTPITLILPGGLVLALAAAALVIAPDSPVVEQAARGYPYAALAAAILLAMRMERSRLFVTAVALAATDIALQSFALGSNLLAHALFATFLPVGFALVAFAHDGGFTFRSIRTHAGLILAPLGIAAFFSAGNPEGTALLLSSRYGGVPLTFLVSGLAVLAIAVSAVRSGRATETGLAWLTIAFALAMNAASGSMPRAIWMLAGALVLIVTLVETAYAMAYHDELTGLPGRRALAQALTALESPFALAVVDVDHFKSFNDTHGHDVGDQVLCMVAAKLRAVGGGGKAFRSGGEEFTLVFPGLSKRDALPYVEDVREAVEGAAFVLRGAHRPRGKNAVAARGRGKGSTQNLKVTVSVGIASPTARNSSVDSVMKSADKAMYKAKNEGRNRVVA